MIHKIALYIVLVNTFVWVFTLVEPTGALHSLSRLVYRILFFGYVIGFIIYFIVLKSMI